MSVTRRKRAKGASSSGRVTPLLSKNDFASYLQTKAREMAPRDVEVLIGQAAVARQRAAADSHPRLGAQMDLAMRILTDHAAGECPQIPYHTISLLAEAVYYFLDPNDAIPDWIPDVGTADDALIVELAFELGSSGVERYCTWKGLDLQSFLSGKASAAESEPAPAPRRAKKRAVRTRKTTRKR